MLNIRSEREFYSYCAKRIQKQSNVQRQVTDILYDIRRLGDRALREFTQRFDGVKITEFRLGKKQLQDLASEVKSSELQPFLQAAPNIRRFHQREKPEDWRLPAGKNSWLGKQWKPLSRIGVYIPGGQAAYPSSVLMNIIPAQVAGVKQIVVASPPDKTGSINSTVAALCLELSVDEVYAMGGAQAIGAMAFGTDSIQPVDKITGPGNAWVAEAKRQVFGVVGIDSVAGPTECLIIADRDCPPQLAAADLLAQAEHDRDARVVLITDDADWLAQVNTALEEQVRQQDRESIIRESLKENSMVVIVEDLQKATKLCNCYAPEHLQIMTAEPQQFLSRIRSAGTVFLGYSTPTALGDYWAGSNHVLPTSGTARFASPLSVYDFMRQQNVVSFSAEKTRSVAETVNQMAKSEGLAAHGRSLLLRKSLKSNAEKPESVYWRRGLTELQPYRSFMTQGGIEAARNELYLNYEQQLQEKILAKMKSVPFNRYPESSYGRIKELLATQLDIEADMILPGAGSNELNFAVLFAATEAGKQMLTVSPSYFSYSRTAQLLGGISLEIELNDDFSYPLEKLVHETEIRQPELIVLARPNNPTGGSLPLETVAQLCELSSGLVLVDEAYCEFAEDNATALLQRYENLVITRTFSKAQGGAGLRFGYLIARPEVIRELQKVVLPYNLSRLTVVAVEAYLEQRPHELPVISEIRAERTRVMERINLLQGMRAFESQANFVLVRCDSIKKITDALQAENFQVRLYNDLPRLRDCFRYSLQPAEVNSRFLDILQNAV